MRQYNDIKKRYPGSILFFRMGDFYEMFGDDALVASKALEITLTTRNKNQDGKIPLCGVPYHAAENYIAKLIKKGFKVAVCDQMEDPRVAKKIVRREVTRVLTPGTALDAAIGQEQNNFLAALHEAAGTRHSTWAVALLDVSTGEFRTAEFAGPQARDQAVEWLLL